MSFFNGRSFVRNGGYLLLSASLFSIATVSYAAPAADSADAADEAGGGEIMVLARKTSENIQQVPIPITVITSESLTRQNLTNFTTWQTKFPAFSVYLTNPKQLNLGIRGIGNNGFNTDGIDGSVGVFVDGVYTGRQGMVSNDFNDIADVELLRGPQGTLFGKNTTAGAVLINTLKPNFDWGATGEATVGSLRFHEFKGSVTGPLIKDVLAFRLSGYYSDREGTYKNILNGSRQNARQASGIRGQLLFTPNDNLSVRVIGTHSRQDFNTAGPVTIGLYSTALANRMAGIGQPVVIGSAENPIIGINSPLNAQTEMDSGSAEINYDMGEKGRLTSITAYQYWSCSTNNDNDYTQLDAIRDYGSCNREDQWSQEARWESPRGQFLEATIGGFLSRQRLKVDSRIQFGSQYKLWSNSALPQAGLTGAGFQSVATFRTNTDAVFANMSIHPDAERKLSIDLGLRYTWERRSEFYNGWVASNPGGLTTLQLNSLSPSGANAQLGNVNDRLTDKKLSGEAGINYKVTSNIFVYAKYARGNKSAGFNLLPYNSSNPDATINNALSLGAQQQVKGEVADSFEAGIKTSFLDHKIVFNLTGFHTVVRNYQANMAAGVGTVVKFLSNVGSLTSDGVEAEMETWLAKGLHTKGFIGYNHAFYSNFPNSVCPAQAPATQLTCNLTGRQVAWAPKWTADFTIDYTHPVSETADVYGLFDVNWRSKQNTTTILDPAAEIDGYALASARVGIQLDHGKYDVQFWIENLFDKAYYINLLGVTKSTGFIQGYPGMPRTWGLTGRMKM
ncbi:MAG TPA: TonB-dependent receptor [Sphingobium sp.]|uniref:TonB-dependent receptor n=1 Tax=Sphingobium sp. TaxID=1912891 RepID=UPI002ED1A389